MSLALRDPDVSRCTTRGRWLTFLMASLPLATTHVAGCGTGGGGQKALVDPPN